MFPLPHKAAEKYRSMLTYGSVFEGWVGIQKFAGLNLDPDMRHLLDVHPDHRKK